MAPLVCERLHLDDAHRGRSAWGDGDKHRTVSAGSRRSRPAAW